MAGIGFVDDVRRMNVALTRPKEVLWVVGSCKSLIQSTPWKALLDDAVHRKIIWSMDDVPKIDTDH